MEPDRAIDIGAEQRKTVLALLKKHLPNTAAWAYGSRVKWTARPQSDLDMVVFASPEQNRQVSNLREAFEESNLPFRVDLFVWDAVPKKFRKQIEAEHAVLAAGKKQCTGRGWRTVTLGDCAVINESTYSPREAWPFVNYLDTGNITRNRISEIQHLTVGKDKVPSRARRKVQPGDIVYSTVRPNQRHYGLLKKIPENFLASTGFAVVRGKNDFAHTDFIYWFLAQDHIVEQLHTIAEHSTSAYPSIRPADIERLSIDLPPLPEQRAIARILGALDDKIELNRRMNETLEAMARALFRSWFVNFDPVRAKMAGRDPNLPQPLADLFPNRLVNSELGEIPEGWEVKPLGECFNLTMGQSPPGSTYNDRKDGLPFFQGRTDFGFRFPENRKFCTAPTRIAQPGDTLVSVRAPVGDINMAREQCCIGRGVAALRHKSGSSSFSYYSAWAVQAKISMYEHTGTVFGAINRKQFEALQMLEPRPELIEAFDAHVNPIDIRIRGNTSEVHILMALRNTLLSDVVSGKIRVYDAARATEPAT